VIKSDRSGAFEKSWENNSNLAAPNERIERSAAAGRIRPWLVLYTERRKKVYRAFQLRLMEAEAAGARGAEFGQRN
jgi:hypothetical protein